MGIVVIAGLLVAVFFLIKQIYARFWDRGLSCKIAFTEDYAVEDDTSVLSEVIVNNKLLPMPVVEIDFHMDRRLQFKEGQNAAVSDQTYRRDVFALSVRQKITRRLEFTCTGRGYFRIDSAGVLGRDLFLTQKFLEHLPQSTDFYVLPRLIPFREIEIPFSRIMGAVLSRKKVYDDPFEFAGLREYSRGDPMKYINWKATARAGELLTNLHESTLSQRVEILIDMEGKGLLQSDVLNEASVRIAATLAERLLRAGVEIGLYSNGHNVQTGQLWKMDSVSGAGSLLYLRKQLACLESGNDLAPACECFPDTSVGGGEEDLLVLISRSVREDLCEDFSNRVGKGRGVRIVPYFAEHKELPGYKNVDLFWMEV